MSEEFEKISQKIDKIETIFTSNMSKLNERDEVIKKKDERIAELTDKMVEITKEKDSALDAKIKLLDEISKERESTNGELNNLRNTVKEQTEEIKKLKKVKKKAQDSVMGSTFEQDRLKKEVEEKEKEIAEIEARIASVAKGSTGVFFDMNGIVEYLKKRISETTRSLRLVIPDAQFLQDHDLIPIIEGLPENTVVNIAAKFEEAENGELITKWKDRGFYLTKYEEANLISISVNGVDVGAAFVKEDVVSGFFTNIPDLVAIFNQAVMHPFISGKKIR